MPTAPFLWLTVIIWTIGGTLIFYNSAAKEKFLDILSNRVRAIVIARTRRAYYLESARYGQWTTVIYVKFSYAYTLTLDFVGLILRTVMRGLIACRMFAALPNANRVNKCLHCGKANCLGGWLFCLRHDAGTI